jgi:type I thyroxine 5'-deiodinase
MYRDRAEFYVVYIREAHPIDGWQLNVNIEQNVVFAKPKSLEEKTGVAQACALELGIEFPTLIDDFSNSTETAYTGWPDRLYVVDRDGRIVHKSGPGPFGFEPAGVEAALARLAPAALPQAGP